MQSFHYQHHPIPTAPASSKALIKLKTDKLIPVTYPLPHPNQPQHFRPSVKFNNSQATTFNHRPTSPVPTPNNNIKSTAFLGPSSFPKSEQTPPQSSSSYTHQPNTQYGISNSQIGRPQYTHTSGFEGNQPLKPLSAFLKSNHLSTNDLSRIRSNSASQFSSNIDQDRRISQLEAKLGDYSEQILQSNARLNEKEKRVTELEGELYGLRQKSNELQLRLQQIQEGDTYRTKRLRDFQMENKNLYSQKSQMQKMVGAGEQKVKSLEVGLDKILKSKNIEIEQLNQSCKQLSKQVQVLHEKHEEERRKLTNSLQSQHSIIQQNEIELKSLFEKLNQYEQSKQSIEANRQSYAREIEEHLGRISMLEAENKTLKTDLSAHIEQLEDLQSRYGVESAENVSMKKQLQRLNAQVMSSKKIADQQIEFLSTKVEESAHEKERLLEQIQLTKAVTLKRNTIFERQIIYELKQENNRLWSKLIERSDSAANLQENSPNYWDRTYSPPTNHPPTTKQPQNQIESINQLQNQYHDFIRELEQQQSKAEQTINELNRKQATNNEQDVAFYKKKCLNLEEMVNEHLQINWSLKQQLQKIKTNDFSINPTYTEVVFLKNQLHKQQILNQTLNRSFELFKQQYEQKFRAAQHKLQQIENQNKQPQNDPNQILIQMLRKEIASLESKNRDLIFENSHLNVKVSQSNRWQSLFLEMKKKCQQMSPISYLKEDKDNKILESRVKQHQGVIEDLRKQLQVAKNFNKAKDEQIERMKKNYELKDQKVQEQLNLAKKGMKSQFNKKQFEYYLSLSKSKLLEIHGFIKQILQAHTKTGENRFSTNLTLVQNADSKMANCLGTFQQLEAAYRQG